MFSRIRYAAHVLSSSPVNPYEHADIAFEEEKPVEITRVSRAIGGLIEIIVVSLVIGTIAAPLFVRLWPAGPIANVNHMTAVVASMLAMLFTHFFERFKSEIGNRLKIGQRVAPYFGHKITEAFKILRG
jgi:hypothetical protein